MAAVAESCRCSVVEGPASEVGGDASMVACGKSSLRAKRHIILYEPVTAHNWPGSAEL